MSTNDSDVPPGGQQPAETRQSLAPEDRERQLGRHRGEAFEREQAWRRESGHEAWDDVAAPGPSGLAAGAFGALAENVRDYAIFLMNPEGIITFWGEGARLIKWWTKAEAEGAHLRMLYPTRGAEDGTAEQHLRDAAERGEYTGEGQRVRRDGSTFWAGVTLTALWDASGKLLGFAKVTRDLTSSRAAEALLLSASAAAEQARAAAEAADSAKTGFLATMSHEIRTPVNAIIGYLDLLSLEISGPLTDAQRTYVARADRGSRHLLALVSEVLDFSRLDARQAPIAGKPFRLREAVTHALGLVLPQAHARGIEIADAMSGHAAGLRAVGDQARVGQIIANLLVNAVKFTDPRRGEAGRVTVSAGAATQVSSGTTLVGVGPWVYVRVEDTGLGIAPNQLETIFEPFVQADMTLTRAHGGTGLGLAISRRLARAMGGEVVAHSEVGVGSTFLLWLPGAPIESLQEVQSEPRSANEQRGRSLVPKESNIGALREVADVVLSEVERVLAGYVARMKTDPGTPSAHGLPDEQIADHFASLLSDLASGLATVGSDMNSPLEAARDSSAIQQMIAERHGANRARLGWSEEEVEREFGILREEVAAAMQNRVKRVPSNAPDVALEERDAEAGRSVALLDQSLGIAARVSLGSFRRTRSL